MGGVDESVQLLALPLQLEMDRCAQGLGDSIDRAERHPLDLATLQPRDHLPREPRTVGKSPLGPSFPEAQKSHRAFDVGEHSVTLSGSPLINGVLPAYVRIHARRALRPARPVEPSQILGAVNLNASEATSRAHWSPDVNRDGLGCRS